MINTRTIKQMSRLSMKCMRMKRVTAKSLLTLACNRVALKCNRAIKIRLLPSNYWQLSKRLTPSSRE